MPHQLVEHTDHRIFHDAVMDHLLRSEAECCVQIGLTSRMVRVEYSPPSSSERDEPLLWTVHDGPHLDAVAIQTLNTSMIVSKGTPKAMECLADRLVFNRWNGNCLIGVVPSIGVLIERYAKRSHRNPTLAVRLRVFQLDRVEQPVRASGSMRRCESSDREILARYMVGFETDIGEPSREDALARADRTIADERMHFWTNPEPVAMAAFSGPTPNGVRLNWVYTPPEFRGRGYASTLVAQLSQHLLNEGRKFCFLFTNQANPTSNSIYKKIGYRAVSNSERWEFGNPLIAGR